MKLIILKEHLPIFIIVIYFLRLKDQEHDIKKYNIA
jgi:hypothetical protein